MGKKDKMINKNLLRILFAEAVPSDVDLAVLELRKEGLRFEHTRVDTRTEFIKALNDFRPDIIISDYMMPSYNGMQALKDAREFDPSVPFILYTGSINKETVVKYLKAGADDYIIKEQMTRLPFAVKEALERQRMQIEKRAAELLLKESEEKLQSIFRVAPVGMGLAVNRVIIEVNDTFCIMTGYNRRELIGKSTEMVVPTREEYEFISLEEERLIAEKGTASVESRLKCKDGRILNIITSATPLDPSDLSKGLIFTVLDITERKQAEKAQQESEEHYRILFNEAQDGICLADAETGLIIDCNQAMSSLVGREWVELIGQSQTILHPPSIYKAAYSPTFEQHLTDKEGKTLETQIVTSKGIIREVEIKANQVNIRGRKTLLGVFRDITERKLGEEELKKNQTQLINAHMIAHLGSWEYDVKNDIFIFNDLFYAIFRTTAEKVGGYTMKSADYAKRFVHPDDAAVVGSEIRKSIESDDPNFSRQLEHRIIYADGETGYITVRFFIVKNERGKTVRTYGVNQDITERKLAEGKLRNSEERLKMLFDYAPDAYYLNDLKGNFIDGNIAAEKLLGYNRNELIGKSFLKLKLLSLKQIPGAAKLLVKNSLGQGTGPDEFVLSRKDGSKVAVEIITHPVKIKDQTLVLGLARDISGRKRTEEALIQSELRFKQISENSEEWIWEIDKNGLYTYSSQIVKKILGYEPEEIINKKYFYEFFNPAVREELKQAAFNMFARKESFNNISKNNLHKDGREVILSASGIPMLNDAGNLIGYRGVDIDITERKHAEEALRESEEKYRRIFENVQDVFYELSIRGKILETSPSIELLSKGQYKRDDLIGKSMYDFYPDLTERRNLLNVLRECGFVSDFEINLKNRDGSNIPCSISAKIIFNVQGRPEKIIGSLRDITERKNASDALRLAKEKAEANDKLKTTFLNNISHEVRTPLNGILGFAEIITQTDLSEEEKKLSHSMLFESSDRLLDTITNYMDISLITSGNMVVKRKDFIPEQIMKELSVKYMTICSAGKLELLLKMPEHSDKLSVNSDPEILNKIMSHLLSNAIKFTKKGSIQYGYKILNNEFEFFVKDTGIGIGKEFLDNIFELFVKEDRGPFRETDGSGLGLPISKGLVDLLGGRFRIESEIGKGSSVFFTIPQSKEKEIHHSVIRTDSQNRNKTIKSILVAEDEEINFFYLKALLKKNISAEIIHASDGKEALEKFQQNPDIGLILMDIKMPVMDGLEATRQIKDIKRNVPIIAITAYAMTGDEDKALEAGCDGYLAKPINKNQLFEKIAEFIEI